MYDSVASAYVSNDHSRHSSRIQQSNEDYQESSTLSFTGYVGTNSLDTDPGYVTMPTSETTGNSISRSSEKVDEIHFSDEPHFQVIPSPTTTPYVGLTF